MIIVVISRLLRFTHFHFFTVIIVSVYCSRFYSFPLISVLAFPFPEFSGLVFSPSSEFPPPIPLRTSNDGSGSRMRPVGKKGGGREREKKKVRKDVFQEKCFFSFFLWKPSDGERSLNLPSSLLYALQVSRNSGRKLFCEF